MNRNPVLIMTSVLAALQVLAGGAALADLLGERAFGLFVLGLAAVQVGWGVYVRSAVTPVADPRAADGTPLVPKPPTG